MFKNSKPSISMSHLSHGKLLVITRGYQAVKMTFLNPPGGWNYWWCRADFGPSADVDPGFWKIAGPLSMIIGDHWGFRDLNLRLRNVEGRTLRVVDSGWLWIWQAGNFPLNLPCILNLGVFERIWCWCWCKDFQNEQCHVDAVDADEPGGKRKPKGNHFRLCGKHSRHFFFHCFAEVSQ